MSNYIQTFEIAKGEDLVLEFEPLTGTTDISSYALIFEAKLATKKDSEAVDISKTTVSGISYVGTAGDFTVTIPSAGTSSLKAGVYNWELWRTDSAYRKRLAFGQMNLLYTIRKFS